MNVQSWRLTRSKKIIFILACLGVFSGGFFYYHGYYQHISKSNVLIYEPARDRDQLLRLFRNNWYWLVASDDYSPEAVFDNLSSRPEDVRYNGTLHVNVIRDKDKLVGFTAYYMKAKNVGQLLFLAVDDNFRGKRYGKELLEHGIDQLKKMGARKVDLVTRTKNVRAQKLYKRVGFKLVRDDGTGFVYFEYIP